jgi:hypothetical protein
MSVGPVVSGSPDVSPSPRQESGTWLVQPGDTLGGIAHQLQAQGMPGTTGDLVRTLARLNGIADPDRIEVGQVLTLPRVPAPPPRPADPVVVAAPQSLVSTGELFRAPERQTLLRDQVLRLTRGWSAGLPTGPVRTPDGTPLFRQGDAAWRTERLGTAADGPTLAHAGCAVTACAMALSRMDGTVVTPDALLRHLRASGGFQGPLLDWSAAGSAISAKPRAAASDLDCGGVDRELDAGRPVLLRVVHDVGGQPRQHWICLTSRDVRTGRYTAADPATGHTTLLTRTDGALASAAGEPVQYASDGRMVTFSTVPAAPS